LSERDDDNEFDDHKYPLSVRNRRREDSKIENEAGLFEHIDCDSRFSLIDNLLSARFDGGKRFNPERFISDESKHMLNLYATQRRFGMCYLFPTANDCPIGVQICFDSIAHRVEQHEQDSIPKRKKEDGNSTSRTNSRN